MAAEASEIFAGRYALEEEVGQGGMSVVWRARDAKLERDVAVKVLHDFLKVRDDARQRFYREARAVARLKHLNIIEIHDYAGEDEARSFIVTEFIDGQTLSAWLEAHPPRFTESGVLIALEICRALEHAHEHGVIHRDLKAENMMVPAASGVLKLMDFGIAQLVDSARLTMTGSLLGSPAYMAPEVIEGKAVDARADLFSLGVILYRLVCGQLPFTGENHHSVLRNVVESRYAPPGMVNRKVGDDVEAVITRLLSIDPNARFQSATELREALERLMRERGLDPSPDAARRLLSDPLGFEMALGPRLRDGLLERAITERKLRRPGRAMKFLSELLAIWPDDKEAQAQLDLIARGGRRKRFIAAAALLLIFGGGAAFALTRPEPPPEPRPVDAPVKTLTVPEPPVTTKPAPRISPAPKPAPTAAPVDTPKAAPPAATAKPRAAAKASAKIARDKGASRAVRKPPRRKAPKPKASPPPAAAAAALPQRVPIELRTFGDIFIDGKKVAENAKFHTAMLTPGPHKLRVEKAAAMPYEQTIEIIAGEPHPKVQISLKAKPATLVVRTTQGALVTVLNWQGKGSVKVIPPNAHKDGKPIQIPMPQGRGRFTSVVRVSRGGYSRVEREITFEAGKTSVLEAELVEKAN